MESIKQKAGSPPDFKSDGVAVWVNKTKDKETYLSIQMAGHNKVNVFKYKPRPKEQPEPQPKEELI